MELTEDQIALAFASVVGAPARSADLSVVRMLGGTVDALAEYIWDHWMGEPDEPTQQQVADRIKEVLNV